MITNFNISLITHVGSSDRVRLSCLSFHSASRVQKSVSEWKLSLDWAYQKKRPYVVVDPNDPSGLLYLSIKEYQAMVRTCLSTQDDLIVVARPGDEEPLKGSGFSDSSISSSSSNSSSSNIRSSKLPPLGKRGQKKGDQIMRRAGRWVEALKSRFNSFAIPMQGNMVEITYRNISKIHWIWFDHLNHSLGNRYRHKNYIHVLMFAKTAKKLLQTRGLADLIKRYKTYMYVASAYLAGKPVKSTEPFGVRVKLANGLPAAFPLHVRQVFRTRNHPLIRIWMSVLYMYRGFKGPYDRATFSTITYPRWTGDTSILESFVPTFLEKCFAPSYNQVLKEIRERVARGSLDIWRREHFTPHERSPNLDIKKTLTASTFDEALGSYPLILSTSPNGSPSIFNLGLDALAWYHKIVSEHKVLRVLPNVEEKKERSFRKSIFRQSPLIRWSEALGDMALYTDITKIFHNVVHKYLPMEGMIQKVKKRKGAKVVVSVPFKRELDIGKLSFKEEAAGKLRVFAMVDYFTQRALRPLHDWLLDRLADVKSDGTFDQEYQVARLATLDNKVVFSFDLKSATDLIPIQLYEVLLKTLLGPEMAKDWSYIIADRDFRLPRSYPGRIRYTRGQPMGALSSWPMLASVHHLIVQYSKYVSDLMQAREYQPATDYGIVGDDIVIFGKKLSESYLARCNEFDITVGIYKSLESDNRTFSFVSQLVTKGVNISPLSLKDELSILGLPGRSQQVLQMLARGMIPPKPMSLVRAFISPLSWEVCVEPLSRGETPVMVVKALRCLLSQPAFVKQIAPNKLVLPLLSAVKPEKGMVTIVSQLLTGSLELKYKPVPLIKKLLVQLKTISSRLLALLESYTALRASAEPYLEGKIPKGFLPVLSNPEVRVICRTVAISADSRVRRLEKDIRWVQERYEYHDDVFRGYALMRKTAKAMGIKSKYKGPTYRDMLMDIQKDLYKALSIYFSYPSKSPEQIKDALVQTRHTSRAREISSTKYLAFLRSLVSGLRTLNSEFVGGLPLKVKTIKPS